MGLHRERVLEACYWFPWTSFSVPFPFADFALHPFTLSNHSGEYNYMLSPTGPPRESSKWGGFRVLEILSLHRSKMVNTSCPVLPTNQRNHTPSACSGQVTWKSVQLAEWGWGQQASLRQAAAPQLLTIPASSRQS